MMTLVILCTKIPLNLYWYFPNAKQIVSKKPQLLCYEHQKLKAMMLMVTFHILCLKSRGDFLYVMFTHKEPMWGPAQFGRVPWQTLPPSQLENQ